MAEASKLAPGTVIKGKARGRERKAAACRLTSPPPQVELANRGGVIVRLSKNLTGFCPLSQLDPNRLPAREEAGGAESALAALVGSELRCLVLEVSADKGGVVLSEKAAGAAEELGRLAVGQVVGSRVKKLAEYGAFVELRAADGRMTGLEGLLHISELSWSRVRHPQDLLRLGQELRVKVITLDAATGRISLSLRQLEADPLLETLDTILPGPGGAAAAAAGEGDDAPLPGLAEIVEALRCAGGVEEVVLGRQAREQRVVSQDLELWMTNDKVEDGFNLVARAGRLVQEVHLRTGLSREAVRALVLKVTAEAALSGAK